MNRQRFGAALAAILFVLVALPCAAAARQGARVATASGQLPARGRAAQPAAGGEQEPAAQTRGKLYALLAKCPPSVGRILKLDPTLLANQAYLSAYPELAAYLGEHPEVARDPGFFLEDIEVGTEYHPPDVRQQALSFWRSLVEGSAMFLVFLVIVSAIIWLVRALIEHRRWLRSSKVQMEMHNKLFDRFSTNEDLMAYVQSPAGRRFFESLGTGIDFGPREAALPVRRILWAAQVGLVFVAGGCGLLFISARVIQEVQQPLFALGVVFVSLGIGFMASAVVSYALARHMGVLADRRAATTGA